MNARPRWAKTAPYAATLGGLAYGALQLYWTLGHHPGFPPLGTDLGPMSGWPAVALSLAAALLAPLTTATTRAAPLTTATPRLAPLTAATSGARRVHAVVRAGAETGAHGSARRADASARPEPGRAPHTHPDGRGGAVGIAPPIRVVAAVVALGLVVSSFMIVLDLVALVFPGIGIPSSAASVASRGACLGVGVALALTVLAARRAARGACPYCGRTGPSPRREGVPRWAVVAAYVAVAGCLVRFGAQVSIGFTNAPIGHSSTGSAIAAGAFTVAMLLAGTLLPIALVHRWGRVFPRWTLILAGRRVPRPLLTIPACLVSAGLLVYFGTGLGQMIAAAITGAPLFAADIPGAFVWTAVLAYLAWGAGLAAATGSYLVRTRPGCARCGAVDTASRTVTAALL